MEEIPNLVSSGKCQTVVVVGHTVEIEIYRLESSSYWTLEVVDEEGGSHVWDDEFATDTEALDTTLKPFNEEGAAGFLHGGENVVPFRRD